MTTLRSSVLAASLLAAGFAAAALPGCQGLEEEAGYAARLEEAFRLADAAGIDERLLGTLAAAARKADRLAAAPDCTGQTWPYAAGTCLAGAVRTVTVEYRPADGTSVLVRMPAAQIASR